MKMIPNLDNNQKLLIYKTTLAKMEVDLQDGIYFGGLCWNIDSSAKELGFANFYDDVAYGNMEVNFPEIYKYKPLGHRLFWFTLDVKGMKKRIGILKRAIKKLESL
jgi:hypothetical protein